MFSDSPFLRRRSTPKRKRTFNSLRRILTFRMADGQEEDFSQLPLQDRFEHKNWKVRKEGYEAAAKLFELTPDESDPTFRPFVQDPGLWKNAAGDSNVAAQQEGLAALCAFLKYGGHHAASRSRPSTIQPIYEKGLASTRPAAKASALEALLLYVEIDKPDMVVDDLLPALSNKQPKVIAATLSALTAIFHNFGVKVVDPKPVLKQLPKIFGHADKNVRAEGSNLAAELYRWLKEAMKTVFWSDLKPVQQQDLEKLFEKIKEEPSPRQERNTRAQQAALQTHVATIGDEVGGESVMVEPEEEEPVEVDVFDLSEPVDVYSKIPEDFYDNVASTKWKERKDALDALFNTLNTPRIKDGHFDEVVRTFAKCMKDANIAVVTVAANCVEKLALGLRRHFARYRSSIVMPMMERLKEKKQSVADALGAALDAVFGSTSLSDCLEDILASLTNKNPQVKVESIKFLVRCMRTTPDVPSKNDQKSIADAATKLLTESTEAMRSGGAEILGTLMKIIGERGMGPYLDGLDDIRKTKIKEYFDTAEVKAKEKPKPIAQPPKKTAGASAVGKKVVGGAKKSAPSAKRPSAAPTADDSAPLQPRPTAKSMPKPGGLPKPGSGLAQPSGMKLSGLKKPSGAGGVSSPQRRVISPPMSVGSEEEAAMSAPSPSKFGMPGRGGFAGRSLARPQAQQTPMSPHSASAASSGLSAIERTELEELRAEKDRLTGLTDNLRSQNAKLTTEVTELQNQNAQLIEDHTRDVLQIKAKETQLVRARGEVDVLKQEVESARKEADRYKREVSRLGRESFGRDMREREDDMGRGRGMGSTDSESTFVNGTVSRPAAASLSRTGSNASGVSSVSRPGNGRPTVSTASSAMSKPQSAYLSPSEEKENAELGYGRPRKISPPISSVNQNATSPSRPGSRDVGGSGAAPAENWKRAAEVTSQLKARIEAMKVNYLSRTSGSGARN